MSLVILISALICTLLSLLLFFIYCLRCNLPRDFRYDECPSLLFLYVVALCRAIFRKQGVLSEADEKYKKTGSRPYRLNVIAKDCRVDAHTLAKYVTLCGYSKMPNSLPPIYLETYFIPLMTILAASKQFRLSPIGLIHISQTVTQHCKTEHLKKEPFDLECTVLGYKEVEKGVEVELIGKVYDRREMCVYEISTVLLSRKKNFQKSGDHKPRDSTQEVKNMGSSLVHMPGNLGIRYGEVSGDWAPHHMPILSKILGYKQPVLQGMFTLAKSAAIMQIDGKFHGNPSFHIDVKFKRPLFLPGKSLFTYSPDKDKNSFNIRVCDEKSGVPQLVGTVSERM